MSKIQQPLILVYKDTGTSDVDVFINALNHTLNQMQLQQQVSNFEIKEVSAKDVIDGTCFKNANLLIIPGGRDIPYVEKLKGHGITNIQDFVYNGGGYFGVCAGAYFAADFCEFERGTSLEVCGERYLKFFPGKARGCVYPGFRYNSEEGARVVSVCLQETKTESLFINAETFPAYYNGGCEFIQDNNKMFRNVTVLARYKDNPDKIAIVLCQCGNGRALLSGVHPEMNYQFLIDKSRYTTTQLEVLMESSVKQQQLFNNLMGLILSH